MVKAIDQNAFANTSIKSICIRNVTDFLPINENAFNGCEIKKNSCIMKYIKTMRIEKKLQK